MKLSAIILEYYSLGEIDTFLNNLTKQQLLTWEIIIVSNSRYSKEEQNEIKKSHHNIKWIFNERNGGFAYGMNNGMKVSNGDVIMICNSDVRLRSSIQPMVDHLTRNSIIGIIGPKTIDKNGVIQDSFRNFVNPCRFLCRQTNRLFHKNLCVENINKPIDVDWVIGAFMMVRRDFYEKVGGMSEDYFMYCEDMDWCKRAHLAGFDVVYFPETLIEYKGTRAARKSWKYARIHIKSLFTYWRKYGYI